jgi:hypothetical protein
MHTPRLVVRLIVALLTFILGITTTLLFNYLRPSPRVSQPAQYVIIKRELTATPPAAHAPCGAHEATMQHAFDWTPEVPMPLAPPPPPPPRPRLRTR